MRTAFLAMIIVLLLAVLAAGHQVADAATGPTPGTIGLLIGTFALLGIAVGFLLWRTAAGSVAGRV